MSEQQMKLGRVLAFGIVGALWKKKHHYTINQGWKQADQNYLRMYDNAEAGPEWQLLTEEDLKEDDKLMIFIT